MVCSVFTLPYAKNTAIQIFLVQQYKLKTRFRALCKKTQFICFVFLNTKFCKQPDNWLYRHHSLYNYFYTVGKPTVWLGLRECSNHGLDQSPSPKRKDEVKSVNC